MKTDHLFYSLFKQLPGSFFELIGLSASVAESYSFDSVELKQTAFRIDGVFLPLNNSQDTPTYFAEVQFQKDEDLYARLFPEIFLYLRNNRDCLNWKAVIIFKSDRIQPSQKERIPYEPLLSSQQVQIVYLNELELSSDSPLGLRIIQLVVARKKQIPETVTQLVTQAKETLPNEKIKQQVLNLIETIVLYKLPQISQKELEAMFGTEDLRKTRFAQEMIAQGRAEGRAEGELQTKLKAVPRLLARGLNSEEVAEILELEIEQVRNLAQNQSNS